MDNNAIQLFSYGENPIRIVMLGDPPSAWFVAKDVCDILRYANHRDAIAKHLDDDERRVSRIATPSNGGYSDVTLINESGLYALILRSNMPKAKEFRKWVTSTVIPQVMRNGLPQPKENTPFTSDLLNAAKIILDAAGIKDNQLALALDKVAYHYTGQSLLSLSGVSLTAPTQHQLLTPTQIGKHFGVSGRRINQLLTNYKFQRKGNAGYEPLEDGLPFAVMVDTNKWHSDGTPIRQLKWDSEILDELKDCFVELPF